MWVPTAARALAALALLVSITSTDLERALKVGRGSDAERARFHAAYLFDVNTGDQLATVEQIEILTEFRHAVEIVENRARGGDYMFGLPQLEKTARTFHNQLTIRARLRFNPLNVLPAVPEYELRVGAPDDRLLALGPTTRSPIYSTAEKDKSPALIGTNLEIPFDAGIVGQNTYPVSVVLGGRTIASASVDFAHLD